MSVSTLEGYNIMTTSLVLAFEVTLCEVWQVQFIELGGFYNLGQLQGGDILIVPWYYIPYCGNYIIVNHQAHT